MAREYEVVLDGGKYTWYLEDCVPKCDRYGEPWREEHGDTAIFSLVHRAAQLEKIAKLAEEYFVDMLVQPYAGANAECLYCCSPRRMDGTVKHNEGCPQLRYKAILEED